MATGTVKWFSEVKGYGFITPDEGANDLFLHQANIAGHGFQWLPEGARVVYEVRRGAKGCPKAINVVRAD
jgi:cold shock protein